MTDECTQLTDGLQHIHKLKRKCDEFLSNYVDNKQKINKLSEMKRETEKLFDQILIMLPDGRKLLKKQYDCVLQFVEENNTSLEYFFPETIPNFVPVEIYNGKVTSFHIIYTKINSFESLFKISTLKKLAIEECRLPAFPNNTFEGISKLKDLAILDIKSFDDIGNYNFSDIKNIKSLSFLNVSGTDFNNNDLRSIAELPLKTLILDSCQEIDDLHPLRSMSNLKRLSINIMSMDLFTTDNIEILRILRHKGVEIIGWMG